MTTVKKVLLVGTLAAAIATPVIGQVHKYFTPGTVWTVSMIRIAPGMDQMYMEYLDGRFKKGEDAQVKAGFQKSYKILRTLDDGGEWNLLILREYESLAAIEANLEKADALTAAGRGHRPGSDAGLPRPQQVPGGRWHKVRARGNPQVVSLATPFPDPRSFWNRSGAEPLSANSAMQPIARTAISKGSRCGSSRQVKPYFRKGGNRLNQFGRRHQMMRTFRAPSPLKFWRHWDYSSDRTSRRSAWRHVGAQSRQLDVQARSRALERNASLSHRRTGD